MTISNVEIVDHSSEDLEAPDESRLIRIAKNGVRVRGKE